MWKSIKIFFRVFGARSAFRNLNEKKLIFLKTYMVLFHFLLITSTNSLTSIIFPAKKKQTNKLDKVSQVT